jgi:hypothetical protein
MAISPVEATFSKSIPVSVSLRRPGNVEENLADLAWSLWLILG